MRQGDKKWGTERQKKTVWKESRERETCVVLLCGGLGLMVTSTRGQLECCMKVLSGITYACYRGFHTVWKGFHVYYDTIDPWEGAGLSTDGEGHEPVQVAGGERISDQPLPVCRGVYGSRCRVWHCCH